MAKRSQKPVVLIMAGGRGERFWPRSRESCPKQLQKVYSDRTLLEETLIRARAVTTPDSIFIGCSAALKKAILKGHRFPSRNFILEPEGRNTAPIIALAALELERRFPDRVHLILSADHFITPLRDFAETIRTAVALAERQFLVTLGVRPTRPDTGYGYIEVGDELWDTGGRTIRSFTEKPDQKKAKTYIGREDYFWNSGIFLWKGSVILEEFALHAPEILEPIRKSHRNRSALARAFRRVPARPIDIAIMEKSRRVAMVPAQFAWDDVGSWLALERIVPAQEGTNVFVGGGGRAQLLTHAAHGNIVVSSGRPVFLLGAENMVVVAEQDLVFVASRAGIDQIKDLTAAIRSNKTLQRYLT